MLKGLIAIVALIIAGIVLTRYGTSGSRLRPTEATLTAQQLCEARLPPLQEVTSDVEVREIARTPITLEKVDGIPGPGVILGALTVANRSMYLDVKDVRVACTQYCESGTALGTDTHVIYKIIKAHSCQTIEGIEMRLRPQAASQSCKIVGYAAL